MKKAFFCKDIDVACDWEGIALTEEELLEVVVKHAADEHGMKELTEPMRKTIICKIRDVN